MCFLVPSLCQVALWLVKKMLPLRGTGCLFRQVALSLFTNQCAPWSSPFFLCTRLVKSHSKGIFFLCFFCPIPLPGSIVAGCLFRQVTEPIFLLFSCLFLLPGSVWPQNRLRGNSCFFFQTLCGFKQIDNYLYIQN